MKYSVCAIVGLVSCSMFLIGCGKNKGDVVNSAVIPGAHMVFSCDMKAMQQSAMYKQIKALSEEQADLPGVDAVKEAEKMKALALKTMGINDENVKTVVVSAKFIGDDLDKMEGGLSENAEIAIGVQLDKAVTLDQVEEFVRKSAEDEDEKVTLTRGKVSGVETLAIEKETEDDKFHVACVSVSGGTVVLGGTQTGLANAFTRLAKPVPVARALNGSGIPADVTPQCFFAVSLSDAMKTKLNETLAMMLTGGSGPQAQIGECFVGMSGATFTVDLADDMGLALFVNLASVEKAAQLKNLFDNVVLSGIKMGASMMTGGKPLPMLNAMTSAADATTASVKMSISSEDINTIKAVSEEKKAAPGAMYPAPGPDTPPTDVE